MANEGFVFCIQMDISPVYPFSKEDGTPPIASLEIFNTDPSTSIATLYRMKQTIEDDSSYLFYCLFKDAVTRTDDNDLDPEKFRFMLNDMTEWLNVDFPVEVSAEHGTENVHVIVTAPGYRFIVTTLQQLLQDENIEGMINEMFENDLFEMGDIN